MQRCERGKEKLRASLLMRGVPYKYNRLITN